MRFVSRAVAIVPVLFLLSGCGLNVAGLSLGGTAPAAKTADAPKGTPYGTVDGKTVSAAEVAKQARLQGLGETEPPALTAAALSNAWTNIVDEILLLKAHPNTPAASEVSEILSEETQYLQEQHGGAEGLAPYLKAQGLSSKDVKSYVTSYVAMQTGMQTAISSLVTAKQETAYVKAHPSKFETASVRHVLVATKALAETILKKLEADPSTANWKVLAKQYSTDTGSNTKGGLYTGVTPGEMVAPFNAATFSWKIGKIGIVHSQYGYHVMQVTARKAMSTSAADQAAYQTLYTQAATKYLTTLRKQATIVKHTVGKK